MLADYFDLVILEVAHKLKKCVATPALDRSKMNIQTWLNIKQHLIGILPTLDLGFSEIESDACLYLTAALPFELLEPMDKDQI